MHFRADAPHSIDLTRSLSTERFVPGGKGNPSLLCCPIDWKIPTDRIDHHSQGYVQIHQIDRAENDGRSIRCDDVACGTCRGKDTLDQKWEGKQLEAQEKFEGGRGEEEERWEAHDEGFQACVRRTVLWQAHKIVLLMHAPGDQGALKRPEKNGKRAKQVRLEKAGKMGRGKLTIEGESGGNRCDEGKKCSSKNLARITILGCRRPLDRCVVSG